VTMEAGLQRSVRFREMAQRILNKKVFRPI
jgi:hypothetical protein